jgi:hypothetical protein
MRAENRKECIFLFLVMGLDLGFDKFIGLFNPCSIFSNAARPWLCSSIKTSKGFNGTLITPCEVDDWGLETGD